MAKLLASCVHANFSHFYMRIFVLRIFCQLSVHWNSLSHKKSVNYCLVITLWKGEYCLIWVLKKSMFGSNSLKVSVLCGMNYEKTFYNSLISKNSLKMPVLLGINSRKVRTLFCICWWYNLFLEYISVKHMVDTFFFFFLIFFRIKTIFNKIWNCGYWSPDRGSSGSLWYALYRSECWYIKNIRYPFHL